MLGGRMTSLGTRAAAVVICWITAATPATAATNSLYLPTPGFHELNVLSPTVVELMLVTTKAPDPAPPTEWNFVSAEGKAELPRPDQFAVSVGGTPVTVAEVSF